MKSSLIREVGAIDAEGRLRLPMDRLTQAFREHAGERAIIKIEFLEKHSTAAVFGYYFGYILPTLRQELAEKGTLATEKDIHEAFWNRYPGEHNPDQDIREAPASQVRNYIDWLKCVTAEYIDIYIQDPYTI